MEELASIWYNVISLNQKTGKRYMTMTTRGGGAVVGRGVRAAAGQTVRPEPALHVVLLRGLPRLVPVAPHVGVQSVGRPQPRRQHVGRDPRHRAAHRVAHGGMLAHRRTHR